MESISDEPVSFRREGGKITLVMCEVDYERLLMSIGYLAGLARAASHLPMYWDVMRFCNDLNAGNPDYRPYEIPEETVQ